MLSEITAAAKSAAQSAGANRMIAKAAEFYETKFRDPELVSSIENRLKTKFDGEPFYNDFDAYITGHRTIERIIDMLYNIGKVTVLSSDDFVKQVLNEFSEQYPQYGVRELSIVKEGFEIIYDSVYSTLTYLNPHTDIGRLQMFEGISAAQSRRDHDEIKAMLGLLLSQTSSLMPNKNGLNETTREDIGSASENIKRFLKDIDSIGSDSNPAENDLDAIDKYQKKLADVPIVLRGENEEQIDTVICSLESHLAIHYSNLGDVAKALDCLSKVPLAATENSKLYHFVRATIIVGHCLKDKYSEAEYSLTKALELDENYHRAFLIAQLLSATQKRDTLDSLLYSLDSRFLPIVAENADSALIADYYMHRGFICKEFDEYDTAEQDFILAKKYGYDDLIADYNIGLLYYSKATSKLPRDKRLFCVQVDIPLLVRIVSLYEKWLLGEHKNTMPLFVKTRMAGIYASCCGLLSIKHNLTPIKEYVSLPNLEYESLRTIILGCGEKIDDDLLSCLCPEDQLYIKLANLVNYGNYEDCKLILETIPPDEAAKIPTTTVYLILQACVANKDLESYNKFRIYIKEKDPIGLIDCVDAYALERNGEVETAKRIIDQYAVTSTEYALLRNMLGFYIRNNYHSNATELFLRILDLSVDNKLYIDDKLDFCKHAILYFLEQRSMNAQRFVNVLNADSVESWRLRASFYDAINDAQNLLIALTWLCENAYSYRFCFNKVLCLVKLMKYEEALAEALELFPTIDENNIKDRTNVIWLISNIYLFLGNDSESANWAKKAHELNIDTPNNESHQAYFARTMRTGVFTEPFKDLLEYKKRHPVVLNEWLKEMHVPASGSGEDFIKAMDQITGYSHEEYEQQERAFLNFYKNNVWCPNSLVFRHYGKDYAQLFWFAKNQKLRISSGIWPLLKDDAKTVIQDLFVDSLTLVLLQHCNCLDTLNEIATVRICYATLQVLHDNFQMYNNAGYVSELLKWIRNANNVIFEPDGFQIKSSLTSVFEDEYLICCRNAAQKNIPLLTIETSAKEIIKLSQEAAFENLETISVVTLCYATMNTSPEKLSNMLYGLLDECKFINFTAATILEQIKASDYNVDVSKFQKFFICNSSYDMMSFERVYIQTIKALLAENKEEAAIKFALLVLENATTIWRKGFHYRYLIERFQDQESDAKHSAIITYLASLVRDIAEVFHNAIPEQLLNVHNNLKRSIVGELSTEHINKTLREIETTDN